MRTRSILLSAAAAFSIGCFGQDKPLVMEPLAPQPFRVGKLPGHIKLFQGFARNERPLSSHETRPFKVTGTRAEIYLVARCGHITVTPAPANVDPQIVLKVPETSRSNMPVFRGLPPCPANRD